MMTAYLDEKLCKGCDTVKPRTEYYGKAGGRTISHLCRPCMQPYNKERDARRRDSGLLHAKNVKRYGITAERYDEMLTAQGGHCATCPKTPEQNGKRLCVDHDHACCDRATGICGKCVRGLLCADCNQALGVVGDNAETLLALAAYLTQSEPWHINFYPGK
jgi:hypothetical protein